MKKFDWEIAFILIAFIPWAIVVYTWHFLQLKLKVGRLNIRIGEIPKFCLLLLLISPFVAVAMVGIYIEDLTDFIKRNK